MARVAEKKPAKFRLFEGVMPFLISDPPNQVHHDRLWGDLGRVQVLEINQYGHTILSVNLCLLNVIYTEDPAPLIPEYPKFL